MLAPMARRIKGGLAALFRRPSFGKDFATHPTNGPVIWTANLLSRFYLPPVEQAVKCPEPGLARAAGRYWFAFYAVAFVLWAGLAYLGFVLYGNMVNHAVNSTGKHAVAFVRDMAVPYDKLPPVFVALVSGPWAWAICLGAFAFVAALFLADPSKLKNLTSLQLKLLTPFLLLCFVVKLLACAFATVTVLAIAYPGLFDPAAVPTARVPWQVWFAVVCLLFAYRGATALNPRLYEMTFGLTRSLSLNDPPLLYRVLYIFGSLVKGKEPTCSEPTEVYHRRKLLFLRTCQAFYEREGLADLRHPENPERRFYTFAQQLAFAEAYGEILDEILKLERQGYDAVAV
jgi:hypothetical protein